MYLIGIAGGTASGKTTLANILKESFQDEVTIIKHDYYYYDKNHFDLPETEINFDHPASFETELMVEHLEKLNKRNTIYCPRYSYKTNERLSSKTAIKPTPIVIVEGILIFYYKELCNMFDLKIYVETDADVRLLRRISRDIHNRDRTFDSVKHKYLSTVKPMHEKYVKPTRYKADIIIPNGGLNEIANDLIIEKITSKLY